METTIRINECKEDQKVKFVSHSFVSEALCWWDNLVQAMGERAVQRMKWKEFKNLVTDQYCPSSEVNHLEKEFVTLEADKMTLHEYIIKFNRKARLFPDMVKPESKKIERFIFGLPSDIKKHVILARPNTFRSVVYLSRRGPAKRRRNGVTTTERMTRRGPAKKNWLLK
jgi:hypothetical protein